MILFTEGKTFSFIEGFVNQCTYHVYVGGGGGKIPVYVKYPSLWQIKAEPEFVNV
jgi:hypothetical protein